MGYSVKVGSFAHPMLCTKEKETIFFGKVSILNPSPRHQNGPGHIHIHIDFSLWLIAAFEEGWKFTFQLRCGLGRRWVCRSLGFSFEGEKGPMDRIFFKYLRLISIFNSKSIHAS